jgi:hypothetical protein
VILPPPFESASIVVPQAAPVPREERATARPVFRHVLASAFIGTAAEQRAWDATGGVTGHARVELYNIIGKIDGRVCTVANGWKVARYEGATRREELQDFGHDEKAARAFAAEWNAE